MRDWLTIELALDVLLVTSFTCVGLLAVWAATTSRHWFVRFAVVVTILAPLLLIPAYELFLGALLAIGFACVMMTLQWLYQGRTQSKETWRSIAASLPRRFSLGSTLLVIAVLSVLLAVIIHVPRTTWLSWILWSVGGMSAGVASIKATLVLDRSGKVWHRLVIWMILVFLVPLLIYRAAFVTFTDVWLSISSATPPLRFLSGAVTATVAALLLASGAALMARAFAPLAEVKSPVPCSVTLGKRTLQSRVVFVGFLAVVAASPLIVLWELLHPLPILADQIPTPNGYERVVELGKRLENSAVVREYMADPIDYAKLATAVSNQSSDYAEIREAIALPGWIPVYYDEDAHFADMGRLTAPRQIAKALAARCEIARRSDDLDDVWTTYFDMLRLAEAMHRGGVALEFLIATACEEMAHHQMYHAVSKMDAAQCALVQDEIAANDARRRGIDEVLYREKAWQQRVYGWIGRLAEFIGRIVPKNDSSWDVNNGVVNAHRRQQAISRLLMLELALRAYHLEHGEFPSSLDQLVPMHIAQLPTDPFDAQQRTPVYAGDGNGYLLYSVGPDGVDDGGQVLSGKELPRYELACRWRSAPRRIFRLLMGQPQRSAATTKPTRVPAKLASVGWHALMLQAWRSARLAVGRQARRRAISPQVFATT